MIFLALSLSLVTHDMGKTQSFAAKDAALSLSLPESANFTRLHGGMTKNRNFQVGRYVFRFLDLAVPRALRNGELIAHGAGASLGIAPKIYYTDKKAALCVIDYLKGRHIAKDDASHLVSLAKMLKQLHSYEGPYARRYTQHLRAYLHWERGRQIRSTYPEGFAKEVQKLIGYRPVQYVPIHGDVIPSNVIVTEEGPLLIDWTNATYDSPLVDLALLPVLLNVPVDVEDAYLEAYGDIDRSSYESAKKRALLLSALIYFTNQKIEQGHVFYNKYLESPL